MGRDGVSIAHGKTVAGCHDFLALDGKAIFTFSVEITEAIEPL